MDGDEEQKFQEEIGMRFDPEKEALRALKAHQEAMGMVFDDPDAPVAPDAKAVAQAEDEEIDRMGSYMGRR